MIIHTIISVHLSALMRFRRQLHKVHKTDAQWRGHACTNVTSPLRKNRKPSGLNLILCEHTEFSWLSLVSTEPNSYCM
jgi:hypothetical protein